MLGPTANLPDPLTYASAWALALEMFLTLVPLKLMPAVSEKPASACWRISEPIEAVAKRPNCTYVGTTTGPTGIAPEIGGAAIWAVQPVFLRSMMSSAADPLSVIDTDP